MLRCEAVQVVPKEMIVSLSGAPVQGETLGVEEEIPQRGEEEVRVFRALSWENWDDGEGRAVVRGSAKARRRRGCILWMEKIWY